MNSTKQTCLYQPWVKRFTTLIFFCFIASPALAATIGASNPKVGWDTYTLSKTVTADVNYLQFKCVASGPIVMMAVVEGATSQSNSDIVFDCDGLWKNAVPTSSGRSDTNLLALHVRSISPDDQTATVSVRSCDATYTTCDTYYGDATETAPGSNYCSVDVVDTINFGDNLLPTTPSSEFPLITNTSLARNCSLTLTVSNTDNDGKPALINDKGQFLPYEIKGAAAASGNSYSVAAPLSQVTLVPDFSQLTPGRYKGTLTVVLNFA